MKNILATVAAALVVIGGSGALAGNVVPAPADPLVPAPVPAPADDWTGFYFGGAVGWASGETVGVNNFNGVLYGGFAGYNYQFDNNLVLGAEVAASTGTLDWDGGATDGATFFDLKARAGYAADRALVYASGGYSFASFDGGDEGNGFNVGAGVDYLVFDNAFVGAEYVYRDIEDSVADPAAWQDQFGTIQLRVGLSF